MISMKMLKTINMYAKNDSLEFTNLGPKKSVLMYNYEKMTWYMFFYILYTIQALKGNLKNEE